MPTLHYASWRDGMELRKTNARLGRLSSDSKGQTKCAGPCHRLREIHLDHLYISPIGRVRETVRMMDLDPAIPVTIDDRLREMHMGAWEGRTAAEIEVAHPLCSCCILAKRRIRTYRRVENPLTRSGSAFYRFWNDWQTMKKTKTS